MITLLAIGKKHESWIQEGVRRYEKRLRKPFDIKWVYLPHSSQNANVARQKESEEILSHINKDDHVILLDERGANLSSNEMEAKISDYLSRKSVTIIIGGAYGVNDSVYKKADFVWSISKLVFPHQLIRLIMAEQIYRIQEIYHGNPYHHE